jgi:microcompartment protein CcmL/EutN
MQQALGLIETKGLIAAIEAADAMVKAARVTFSGHQKVKGEPVAVMMSGDVGAVKAAVDAGSAACREVGTLISTHVIPRPHDDIAAMIPTGPDKEISRETQKKRPRRRVKRTTGKKK